MSGHIVYVNKEWYHGDIFFFVSFMLLGIKEIFLYPFYPNSIHSILSFTLEPSAMNRIYMILTDYWKGVSKGIISLWQGPETASLVGRGAKLHIKPLSAPQRVNFKIVQRTILKEGTPCKRGRSLTAANFSTD